MLLIPKISAIDPVGVAALFSWLHPLLHRIVSWRGFGAIRILVAEAAFVVACFRLARLRREKPGLDAFLNRVVDGGISVAAGVAVDPDPPRRSVAIAWALGGLLFLCGAIVLLEIRQPYYFCQDDMMVAENPGLPVIYRSVWDGVLPEWDGHILMGVPIASAGAGRLFYPPAYLAYAIARHLLGNEFLQIDVAAILHLLAGYLVTYWVLRRLGVSAALAAMGSLTVMLSGSMLIMGRCWAMFLYAMPWLPLLMLAVARLTRGPVGWIWVLYTGGTIGILYQIGFVQIWVMALMFCGLLVLLFWLTKRIPFSRVLWFGAAATFGIALATPLMLQQWLLTRDMEMLPRDNSGIGVGLLAMILPYPLAHARHPSDWGGLNVKYMGAMYYIGPLFVALAVLAVAAVLSGGSTRKRWGNNNWALMALLVFLFALGPDAGFWLALSNLPLVSIICHYPFRLLPLLTLFVVFAGAIVAERLLRGRPFRARWEFALALGTAGLLACHVCFARASFYEYGFRPTTPLTPALGDFLHGDSKSLPARIMSWAPERSSTPEYRDSMKHNLPMLDGLLSFTGYDPLTMSKPAWATKARMMAADPITVSRAYGVRWHLLSRLSEHPVISGSSRALEETVSSGMEMLINKAAIDRHDVRFAFTKMLPELSVAEVSRVDPLAFMQGHPENPLPVKIDGRGIEVDTSALAPGQSGTLILNWIWYPPMHAFADGRPIYCEADNWGRIAVALAGPASSIRVWYLPDWETGLQIAGVLALVSLLAAAALQIYRKPIDAMSGRIDRLIHGPPDPEAPLLVAAESGSSAARPAPFAREVVSHTRNSRH